MMSFSVRNGFKESLKVDECSQVLRNKIYAYFYREEFESCDTLYNSNYTTGIEDLMVEVGLTYEFPENFIYKTNNAKKLEKYLTKDAKWYELYDFIELYINYLTSNQNKQNKIIKDFNKILESEVSMYRIIDKKILPITNELEIETVKNAINTKYDSVNMHIEKALNLYADRRNPDYENSIKESISAVESICCIITGEDGKKSTLGNTIKKLKDCGIHIHGSMEAAYSCLYGYTSDENGIRHGGIDYKDVPSEDAKYMLVSCSAFVNYLIEKWSKVNND